MAGKVYLVGAGPGDPGLLTIKGRACLEHADVVIYDYLANPRLLDHTQDACERVLAGKHGGGTRVEQSDINDRLVAEARRGKCVVRLKGGDPFLFGRGGEEAEALREAGVEFEIVPGVTAAIAAPAYAGIPVTHRDWASNLVITTGYEYPDKPQMAVHWGMLGRPGTTLVALMSQRQLRHNMEQLAGGGIDPNTPAAAIEWGTRAVQRTIVGTVATIADLAQAAEVRPPVTIIVGDVVRMRTKIAWVERRPLFGQRILVTRPRHQAAEFTRLLESQGAEVVALPMIETIATASGELDAAFGRCAEFDWVVFTSANGVQFFFDRLSALDLDVRMWHRARFAAIGPQTARSLHGRGIRAELVPDDYRAEGLIAAFETHRMQGQRVLLPRAGGARQVLPETLRQLGAVVEEVITYRSVLTARATAELRAVLDEGIDLVTFTSSSTVESFVAALADAGRAQQIKTACIGPITAATAREHGFPVVIESPTYTVAALTDAILAHFSALRAAQPKENQ